MVVALNHLLFSFGPKVLSVIFIINSLVPFSAPRFLAFQLLVDLIHFRLLQLVNNSITANKLSIFKEFIFGIFSTIHPNLFQNSKNTPKLVRNSKTTPGCSQNAHPRIWNPAGIQLIPSTIEFLPLISLPSSVHCRLQNPDSSSVI